MSEFKASRLQGLSLAFAGPEALVRHRAKTVNVSPILLKMADVYSTSILIFEMISRSHPWKP